MDPFDEPKRRQETNHYRPEEEHLPRIINRYTPKPKQEKLKEEVLVTPSLLRDMVHKRTNIADELQEMMRKNAEPEPEPLVLTTQLLKEMSWRVSNGEPEQAEEPEEAVEVLLSKDILMDLIQMTTQKSQQKIECEPSLLTLDTFTDMLLKEPEEEFVLTGTMIMDLIKKASEQSETVEKYVKKRPKLTKSNSRLSKQASSVCSSGKGNRSKELLLTGDVLMKMLARVAGHEDKEETCPTCCQSIPSGSKTRRAAKKKSAVDVDEDFRLMSDVLMKMIKKAAAGEEEIIDRRSSRSSLQRSTKRHKSDSKSKTVQLACPKEGVTLTPKMITELMKSASQKPQPKKGKKVKDPCDIGLDTDHRAESPSSAPKNRKKVKPPCSTSELETESEPSCQALKSHTKSRSPCTSELETESGSPCPAPKKRKKVKSLKKPAQKKRKKVKPLSKPGSKSNLKTESEPPCPPSKNHAKAKTLCSPCTSELETEAESTTKTRSKARKTVKKRKRRNRGNPDTISHPPNSPDLQSDISKRRTPLEKSTQSSAEPEGSL